MYNIFNNILGSTIGSTTSGAVSSVAGKTGVVSLVSTDITNFQSSVSLNADVISSKNKTQKLDTSGNINDTIIPSTGGLINLGSVLQKFKEGHFNFLKTDNVECKKIIPIRNNDLEIFNQNLKGIIIKNTTSNIYFNGPSYISNVGKYLKIDNNGMLIQQIYQPEEAQVIYQDLIPALHMPFVFLMALAEN
jgi:hypothetical protein